MSKTYQDIQHLLQSSHNIVITTHIHPDADGIGSEVALCSILRSMGKNALCVNEEPLHGRYRYLDEDQVVLSFQEYQKNPSPKPIDLFIAVDTNNTSRVGDMR